uniref:Uncharacterized protein n=1 Tax=Globodera rostochiensis TaxID=31243 RepID=A0A914I0W4_GLORO
MSDEGSNYFFVVLPSNVTDYTDNMTSRYRVHLPKPIQFRGAWVCGLYSIQYPHSWASTVGTVEQQWLDIHRQDGETVRVDLPKTSQQSAQGLKEYLNRTITATLTVNRRYRRSKRNAEETADELRRQQQHDGSSADEGGSVVCTKTGRRTVCRRIKPVVPSDDEDVVKTAVTTPTTAQTTTTTKEVPDQARPFSQVEKLGEKMKEKLNSQQRNEEFEKAKETDTANPKRLPTDKEEEEEEKKSTKRLPTDKEEEEKEKTSSKSQEKEIFKEKPLTTPPTPTVSSSPSPVKIAAQTRGEALKGLVEKSQKEKEENKLTTATTRGEALKGILETSGKDKDSSPTTTTTTRGEVLKALMEKSQQEKEEKKNKEPSPSTTTTTRGEVLKGLLDTAHKGKGEKEGKELETAKTNEEALKGFVEKGRRKELAPAKTRGEALKQLLERRKEEKAEDDNHFSYRTDIDRFQVVLLDDPDISHLSMSQQIAYVLGFPNKELVERGEIAKYGVDLRGGFTSFAVYATGLTRSVILGNSLSSLLRIVSTDGEYGQVIERIYDNPMFIPVHPREINELQIELRMMDGKLVPFDYGTVLITLVFKKVINF